MIPGKQYKPEDILEAAWRRRWVIVIPLVLASVATFVVSRTLPNRYKSEAVLLIVPQRVPENYVRPTVTTRLDERLQSIGQQLLSRTQLEKIIQEFDLYPRERNTMIMEDIVEMMRTRDIRIGTRGGGRVDSGAFTVSFESDDPRRAMQVTQRLADLFIRANTEDRAVFAEMTDQFLQSQLEDARRNLMEHEKRLEKFRQQNAGRLPTEAETNSQAMLNTQMQLQALQETISRDRDRQTALQRLIAELSAPAAAPPEPIVPASTSPESLPAAAQLELARTTLQGLQTRLKPDHPDIKRMQRNIKELEKKAAAEAVERPLSGPPVPVSAAEAARAEKLSQYQAEADTIERRLAGRQDEERRLMASMADYRQRLEAAPGLESQLTALMRDYTTLQNTYQSLLAKSQEAKVAANLERRQIGEQFKVVDNPQMPQRPTSPNRLMINLAGVAIGLGIGLAVAGLLEYRDTSLRTEADVLAALSLPVLALVPTMRTQIERYKRRRRQLVLATSGAAVLMLCAAALAWKFKLLSEWMW